MNQELLNISYKSYIEVECFSLKHTLECGQCFRWKKISDNEYFGVILDRIVFLKQENNKLYYESDNLKNIEELLIKYFDLELDYLSLEKQISKIDENINSAIKVSSGMRVLNQEKFETLISYIISANNNIPRISNSIERIAKEYGQPINFMDEIYYAFPKVDVLENCNESDFRKLGVGFRDKYITFAISSILNKDIDLIDLEKLDDELLTNELLKFNGVGPKVAECIKLFSYSRKKSFPIDVWVKRVMEKLYFKENSTIKNISKYSNDNFGEYAGIAGQHLFYNIRNNWI